VGGFHSLSILEPTIVFSDSVDIIFTHGVSAIHSNTGIFAAPGLSLQNLSIDKPGNTIFMESDLLIRKVFKVNHSSAVEVKSGYNVTVGE